MGQIRGGWQYLEDNGADCRRAGKMSQMRRKASLRLQGAFGKRSGGIPILKPAQPNAHGVTGGLPWLRLWRLNRLSLIFRSCRLLLSASHPSCVVSSSSFLFRTSDTPSVQLIPLFR